MTRKGFDESVVSIIAQTARARQVMIECDQCWSGVESECNPRKWEPSQHGRTSENWCRPTSVEPTCYSDVIDLSTKFNTDLIFPNSDFGVLTCMPGSDVLSENNLNWFSTIRQPPETAMRSSLYTILEYKPIDTLMWGWPNSLKFVKSGQILDTTLFGWVFCRTFVGFD